MLPCRRTEKLSKYLNVLIHRLKLVERISPIESKGRSIYRITNNFIHFWFKYVFPNKTMLELDKTKPVLRQILSERNTYISQKI